MKRTVEEMAKDIVKIIGTKCLLNIGGHCSDCKYAKEGNAEHDCQSVLVADELISIGYFKKSQNDIVLSKEKYDKLKQERLFLGNMVNEYCQKYNDMAKRLSDADVFYEKSKERMKEKGKKENATEILGKINNFIQQLANENGIEIKL